MRHQHNACACHPADLLYVLGTIASAYSLLAQMQVIRCEQEQ